MRFRVLGAVEVVDPTSGMTIALGGAQQRRLLAILLVHRGRSLAVDRLMTMLWEEQPPKDPLGAMRQSLARLRHSLRPLAGVSIDRDPTGVRLDADVDDLDSSWFEHLSERSKGVAEPALRLAILDDALAVWRGQPYEEFVGSSFIEAETARLVELRDEAIERRIEALLTLGRHRQALADIEVALVDAPYHESLHGQLVLALYRCGRQIEALRHIADFRQQLTDEVGVECGPALRRLEDAILLQKSDLDWSPAGASAPARAPTPGATSERTQSIRSLSERLELDDRAGNPLAAGERCDLLIELGRLLRRAGDPHHREVLFAAADLAARAGDDNRRVTAVLVNQNGVMASDLDVGDPERVERLHGALAVLGEEVSSRRSRLLANLATELNPTATLEQRLRLSDEAVAMARATGDPRVLAHALRQRFAAIGSPATLSLRQHAALEYADLCRQLGDIAQVDDAGWQLLQVAAESGDLAAIDQAFESFERGGAVWSEQPFYRWNLNVHRAWRRALTGRIDEALALARETHEFGRTIGVGGAGYIYGIQATIFRFEGGQVELSDDTARRLDHAVTKRFENTRGGLLALAVHAEQALLLRHRDAAALLFEVLAPYGDRLAYSAVAMTCPIHHWLGCCLAVLDRPDEAEFRFASALEVETRLGAPTMIARTTIEHARVLASMGQVTLAVAELEKAAALCRTWGLGGLLLRARSEIERYT